MQEQAPKQENRANGNLLLQNERREKLLILFCSSFIIDARNTWYKSIWPQEDDPETLIVSHAGATGKKDVFLQRHPFPTAENPEITTKPACGGFCRRVISTQWEHYTRWPKHTFFLSNILGLHSNHHAPISLPILYINILNGSVYSANIANSCAPVSRCVSES